MKEQANYLRLINKSQELLNLCINYMDSERFNEATDIYNIVLKIFEGIKKYKLNILASTFREISEEMHNQHQISIKMFEVEEWIKVDKHLNQIIKPGYYKLMNFMKEYYRLLEYDININLPQYKEFNSAGLLKNYSIEDRDKIRRYWSKVFDIEKEHEIDRSVHYAFKTLTDKVEPRLITQVQLNKYLLPLFYHSDVARYYDDKNIYDLIMHDLERPRSILKCIKGEYFDANTRSISRSKAFSIFFNMKQDVILKGSLSNDGNLVVKLIYKNSFYYLDNQKITLNMIEEKFGKDFIIQDVIKQHKTMAGPHPYSVNTLRLMTLRWNGKVYYLGGYAKFGAEKSTMDNTLATGGYTVAISDDGKFDSEALDGKMNVHKIHPTTNFVFSELKSITNYDLFKNFVAEAHDRIPHINYVSWDIAVSESETPILIEMNFRGPIYRYQIICKKPMFGELTEDIFRFVKNSYEQMNKQK